MIATSLARLVLCGGGRKGAFGGRGKRVGIACIWIFRSGCMVQHEISNDLSEMKLGCLYLFHP